METKQLTVQPINVTNIESNYNEVKSSLVLVLEKYQGLIFDEHGLKDAKKSRAELNKLKKAINEKKISVKKEYLKPYTDFENKVKELIGLVDEPCLLIDNQVKDFEIKKKEEKRIFVESLIEELLGDCDLCINVREDWLNSSFSNAKIKSEIEAMIEKFEKDLVSIELLKSDFTDELKEIVVNGGDMSEVLQEKTRLEMQHERFKQREEEKKLETEKKEVVEEESNKIVANESQKEETFTLRITCTVEKATILKNFMTENNIKTERVK